MNTVNKQQRKWSLRVTILGLTALIVLTGVGVYFFAPLIFKPTSHVIQSVPYVGMHNNINEYRRPYSRNDVSAAVMSVLGYWNPATPNHDEIDTHFNEIQSERGIVYEDIIFYINELEEYSAEYIYLTINDLSEYLYEYKTPLIAAFPITTDQPATNPYQPARVLVGVNYENETLVFHGYWTGAYTTISFDTWRQLQELRGNTGDAAPFVAIQPIDRTAGIEKVAEQNARYFSPEIDAETNRLFELYALASGARFSENYATAAAHFDELVTDPAFNTQLHPNDRVIVLSRYTEVLNILERYDTALTYGEMARTQNEGLSDPFRYFGSYNYLYENNASDFQDRLSLPHIVSGDTYRHLGRVEAAIEQYEIALEIYPKHESIPGLIAELRGE